MTSFNHDTLQEAILAWEEDDSTELAENLDTIMSLGQDRVMRDLNLETFEGTQSGTLSQGNPNLNKPESIIETKSFYITVGSSRVFLHPRSKEYCRDYWPSTTLQEQPRFVAEDGTAQWYLAPTPNQNYAYLATFTQRFVPLSDSNQSNWISLNLGDLLLYACLAASERFLLAAERANEWEGEYQKLLVPARLETKNLQQKGYLLLGSNGS